MISKKVTVVWKGVAMILGFQFVPRINEVIVYKGDQFLVRDIVYGRNEGDHPTMDVCSVMVIRKPRKLKKRKVKNIRGIK